MNSQLFIALPPTILILTFLALIAVRIIKPANRNYWLAASAGVFSSLIAALGFHSFWKISQSINPWNFDSQISINLFIIADNRSWLVTICALVLLLAFVSTRASRSAGLVKIEENWTDLSSAILITFASLVAILSGNLLFLIFSLALIDYLLIFFRFMAPLSNGQVIDYLFPHFLLKIISLLFVFGAIIVGFSEDRSLTYQNLSPIQILMIFLAASIRLGVFPPKLKSNGKETSKFADNTLYLLLITLAPVVVVVTRISEIEKALPYSRIILTVFGLSVLLAALRWLGSEVEKYAPYAWINGIGGFVIVSGMLLKTEASLSWGVIFLLCGGLISFLFSGAKYSRLMKWFIAITLSGLPLTASWLGMDLYLPFAGILLFFFFSQSILLAGVILSAPEPFLPSTPERWTVILDGFGAGILMITLISATTIRSITGLIPVLGTTTVRFIVPALIVCVFGLCTAAYFQRKKRAKISIDAVINRTIIITGSASKLGIIARPIIAIFSGLNKLLESQSGILWSILLLVLLLTLFQQVGAGG